MALLLNTLSSRQREGFHRLPDENTPSLPATSSTKHVILQVPSQSPLPNATGFAPDLGDSNATTDAMRPSSANSPAGPSLQAPLWIRVGKTVVTWMFIILCMVFLTCAWSFGSWLFIVAFASILPNFPTSDDGLFGAAFVGGVTLGFILGIVLCIYWTLSRCTRGVFNWPEDSAVFTEAFGLRYIWAGGGWIVPIAGVLAPPVGMLLLREEGMDGAAIATVAMMAEGLAVIPELLLLGCVVGLWRACRGGRPAGRSEASV